MRVALWKLGAVLMVLFPGCGGNQEPCVFPDRAACRCDLGIATADLRAELRLSDGPASDAPRPDAGPSDSLVLADATQQSLFERLKVLLSAPNAFHMPPAGRRHGANQLNAKVTSVSLAGGLAAALAAESPQLLSFFSASGNSLLSLADVPDLHLSIRSGWREQAVADSLLATLAPGPGASEAATILAQLRVVRAHIQAFDIGAEIIAREIFIVGSPGGGLALRVELTYVKA